jgi:hypothetical protein
MTGLAHATAASVLTRPAATPLRPQANVDRARDSWQRYRDLKPRDSAAPAAPPPAGEPPPPPKAKKGKRPTHELVRIIEVEGRKAYQPVAVLWLRETGKGFVKLNADLKAGDNLMIAPLRTGAPS